LIATKVNHQKIKIIFQAKIKKQKQSIKSDIKPRNQKAVTNQSTKVTIKIVSPKVHLFKVLTL
jgi:hypothetical protein